MFKDIGQYKIDPRDRAVKLFVLTTSTIVFALIIYMVLPSSPRPRAGNTNEGSGAGRRSSRSWICRS
jgi:hypothetical protein